MCLYAVLAALAVTMRWFPADMVGAWAAFTVSYLAALAVATAAFATKQRREQRAFNEKLGEYRKTNRQHGIASRWERMRQANVRSDRWPAAAIRSSPLGYAQSALHEIAYRGTLRIQSCSR